MSQRLIGFAQVILSGVCFGFLGFFGKTVYAKGVSPGELLSMRFLAGGSILFLSLLLLKPSDLKISGVQLFHCALLGIFGYAVFASCFFIALTGLSASLTVLLLYAYPVLVAIGAYFLFGEKIAKQKWVALPIVMVGLVLLVSGDIAVKNNYSIAFGLAAAVFYSIYILASRKWLVSGSMLAASSYIQLSAGAVLALIHWRDPAHIMHIVREAWPELLAIALVCSVAAMSLFLMGLQRLKAWEVSLLSTAEPLTGIALAVAFLGERLGMGQAVGAAFILAAFVLLAWPEKPLAV